MEHTEYLSITKGRRTIQVIPQVKSIHGDGTMDIYGYAVTLFNPNGEIEILNESDTINQANEAARFFARRHKSIWNE